MTDSFTQNDVDMRAIYMLGSTGFKPCGILSSSPGNGSVDSTTPFALIDLDLFNVILEAICSNCFLVCLVLVLCNLVFHWL